jgi:acyl-CoA synthetase (AMP-forming)/AMP-acid ligase II
MVERYNVAQALPEIATRAPFRPAIVFPAGRDASGRAKSIQLSFRQLDELCDQYAHGLAEFGIEKGKRTLLMARPGVEFIAVVFALLKIGAVPVLIDPGMGRKSFLQCVAETEPTSFIGIPLAHVMRVLYPGSFGDIEHKVILSPNRPAVAHLWSRIEPGVRTLDEIRSGRREPFPIAPTTVEDEGAVAFTSGSTGIPKGVVYLHGMFQAQIQLLHDAVGYEDGEIDLPGLYIFALFNPALGATTVIPDMDPSRSAEVNPAYLVEAIQTHGVTTSFGSPTIWKRVAAYCEAHDLCLPSMKRILMAGAPVPPSLIERFDKILVDGDVYTPFGATEALPITMIGGREILSETAALSEQGKGMCVGRTTQGNTIRIIRITDDPIPEWDDDLVLPQGQVGEIVVKGPVVTRTYLHRPIETAKSKIADREGSIWHRMGDLGYQDEVGRLWFCGRKSHRVETAEGLMLPVPCEALFNRHPAVARTALVGVGERGQQRPVLIVELDRRADDHPQRKKQVAAELLDTAAEHEILRPIQDILFHPSFPVDVRHNAKIQRDKLAVWAGQELARRERIER